MPSYINPELYNPNQSLHRSGIHRAYDTECRDWSERTGAAWHAPFRANVILAPGAFRNWATESDNKYAEKEQAHAALLAKANAASAFFGSN